MKHLFDELRPAGAALTPAPSRSAGEGEEAGPLPRSGRGWGEGIRAAPALALSLFLAAPASASPMDTVVLRALDKITGRVSTLEAKVDSTVSFGTLQITPRHCDKPPPEEKPESAAFLEIVEIRPDQATEQRFTGWMLASSPALSALEHPVYDLWVIDCKNASSAAEGTSQ